MGRKFVLTYHFYIPNFTSHYVKTYRFNKLEHARQFCEDYRNEHWVTENHNPAYEFFTLVNEKNGCKRVYMEGLNDFARIYY